MTIWGTGANWSGEDKSSEFINDGYVKIGWSKENSPVLYNVLREVKVGDGIYIKAFIPRNKTLRIKAFGEVKQTDGNILKVEWIKTFDNSLEYHLTESEEKYNVYPFTFYKEYSDEIKNIIKNAL